MANDDPHGILLELDERRRVSLGKVGRPEHRRYFAHEEPGGVIVLIPAVVMTEAEATLSRAPEVAARIERAITNPETLVRRGGRPHRKITDLVEVWAFCDDPTCQLSHEEDEFGNDRHRLPLDHPAVIRANAEPEPAGPRPAGEPCPSCGHDVLHMPERGCLHFDRETRSVCGCRGPAA